MIHNFYSPRSVSQPLELPASRPQVARRKSCNHRSLRIAYGDRPIKGFSYPLKEIDPTTVLLRVLPMTRRKTTNDRFPRIGYGNRPLRDLSYPLGADLSNDSCQGPSTLLLRVLPNDSEKNDQWSISANRLRKSSNQRPQLPAERDLANKS